MATPEACTLTAAEVADVVRRARERDLPETVAELAEFAVALRRARSDPPPPSDRQAIAVCLHATVVARSSGGVQRRARRLLSQIVGRGEQHVGDHADLVIFEEFVLSRYIDVDSGRGAFAEWARDTSTDFYGHLRAAFTHEVTDASRFYRAKLGIPQRLRVEATADVESWRNAFVEFVLGPDPSVTGFTAAAGTEWLWPHRSELGVSADQIDSELAWGWAHLCWYSAFANDASEPRPTVGFDASRIARSVTAYRTRERPRSDELLEKVQSLETLATQHDEEWAAVLTAIETALGVHLPSKYEQIQGLRQATVLHQAFPTRRPSDASGDDGAGSDPYDPSVDVEREAIIGTLAEALAGEPLPVGNGLVVSVDVFAEMVVDLGRLPRIDPDRVARELGIPTEQVEVWWEHVQRCVDEVVRPREDGAS